jgi:hypothetical protein
MPRKSKMSHPSKPNCLTALCTFCQSIPTHRAKIVASVSGSEGVRGRALVTLPRQSLYEPNSTPNLGA